MYIMVLLYMFVDLEFANICAYGCSDYIFLKPILLIYGLEGIIGEICRMFEILHEWLPYLWSKDEMQADSLDMARTSPKSSFSQLRVPSPTPLPCYRDAILNKSLLLEKFHDTTHLFF